MLPKTKSELFKIIDAIDPVAYAKTRNQLTGAVTQLSPYITRGVITLPEIRDRLLTQNSQSDCQKLIQELAWREYFQAVWWAKGDGIFTDLRFSRDDWQHQELVSAITTHSTGVAVLDDCIEKLYDTGYMHNHARMWTASVACNLARAHWLSMGKWMYYHLADGDPASNFCSWQWVAGTSINKQYTVNQKLINGCSEHKQVRSILTFDRDDVLNQPPPDVLRDSEPFNLKTTYPNSTVSTSVAGQVVALYTPWTLRPSDHTVDRHVLVIDPAWFDVLPVSPLVMDYILAQAKLVLPTVEIFVGDAATIDGIREANVHATAHQTNSSWETFATVHPIEKLFPAVSGYYPSFFKFWKATGAAS